MTARDGEGSDSDAGLGQRRLGWWARRRVNSLDVTIAGLRAKLAATKDAIDLVAAGSSVPGALVYDLRELPRLIAEMEERKRQIEQPNGLSSPAAVGPQARKPSGGTKC